MSIFDNYSQYYNLIYKDKDYETEVDYTHRLLTRFNSGKKLLELGCGTGIHAYFLAQKGYSIEGVDLSPQMLNQTNRFMTNADQEITKKLSFNQGDIRSFRSDKKFDSLISLFHVFSYMTKNDDVCNALKTVNHHLDSSGIFIFDTWYAPAVHFLRPEVKIKKFENDLYFINRISNPEHKPEENTVVVNYELHIHNKETNDWQYVKESHHVRYFSIPEIQYFAEQAGFKCLATEEWLSGNIPSNDSWSVTVVLQKK